MQMLGRLGRRCSSKVNQDATVVSNFGVAGDKTLPEYEHNATGCFPGIPSVELIEQMSLHRCYEVTQLRDHCILIPGLTARNLRQ